MANKVCYWDEVEGVQKERDMTPEEEAQREIDIAAGLHSQVKAPTLAQVVAALIAKNLLTEEDLS